MAKNDNISYKEAMQEIEEGLHQLENEELDVDELTTKLKRISYLLKVCKGKLRSTEEEVNKILHETSEETDEEIDNETDEETNKEGE